MEKIIVQVRNVAIGEGQPKICIPLTGKTEGEIRSSLRAVLKSRPDLIEWRADDFRQVHDEESVLNMLSEIRSAAGDIPILFTVRTKKEGGHASFDADEYVTLNRAVCRSGDADMIDCELFSGEETAAEVIANAHEYDVRVVLSNHDFQKTPGRDELVGRMCRMQELGGDILKIAVMPASREDVLTLLEATSVMYGTYAVQPLITVSMSPAGVISRICGESFGSAVTFASAAEPSAPGQLDAAVLRKILEEIHRNIKSESV
ncbi:MAG: type I 3-dehydroquinate dehydratase [Solobacterium sp.]|nr:type I 3-dehydroquinate dehydratase [Solobacterium sp.]